MVDHEPEDVLDVCVADHGEAQLAQGVGLGRPLHGLPALAFQLAGHVAGRQRHHQEQEDLADSRVWVGGEVGRRERAAHEQVDEGDDHRGHDAGGGAEADGVGYDGQKESEKERARESVR